MYNHEPKKYQCPFCRIAKRIEDKHVITRQDDIFYRDKFVTAFISSHWWPNNRGSVIIIPNKHFENIYSLPNNISHKIQDLGKKIAIALKVVYKCDAVSLRQHNEPDGNQDVWHYHLHVFPRYKNDKLYQLHSEKYLSNRKERIIFSIKLKQYFSTD